MVTSDTPVLCLSQLQTSLSSHLLPSVLLYSPGTVHELLKVVFPLLHTALGPGGFVFYC